MATTTNYGWTTPDNTALVKDGASAIRTLGSSIDTTLKAQIDAQIPDTLLTTTGDVIYASAANTPARLGIGTSGQVLQVSGGLPAWTTPAASGGMTLISTTSFSGTSITLSSIPSTYKHLLMTFTDISFTAAARSLQMRVNGLSTALYTYASVTKEGSSSVPQTSFGAASGALQFGNASFGAGSTVATRGYGSINLYDYTSALNKQGNATFNSNDGGGQTMVTCNYQIELTSTISSITLLSAGTFASGAVKLYGVS
jgi:hypothetical protein